MPDEYNEQAPPESLVEPQLRRSTREHRPSQQYSPNEYVMITIGGEPEYYQEAIKHEQKKKWLKAMQEKPCIRTTHLSL